ncbi:MAG TPA: tryptophan synthase subunit alpha [Blastocatellia bacterium]|nr:tryptophan synthase subunit alpha [Blastocatellia bacterium]
MSRIASKFEELKKQNRKGFIPYVTSGDPDLKTTAALILELERRGADIIELGVPFSDPMADGPVIQRASERALRQSIGVRDCLEVARNVRKTSEVPIVLFSYLNPLLAVGIERLAGEVAGAGIDGVLATDLVPEEAAGYIPRFREAGVDTVFLAAPTSTDERLKLVAESSSGFIYAVSRAGVTGARQTLSEAASELVRRIRKFSQLPIAVGFGVSKPEHVEEVWRHADAAVVGSRIVAEIEERTGNPELIQRVGDLTAWLVSTRTAGASS